jgi:hypothetical protein
MKFAALQTMLRPLLDNCVQSFTDPPNSRQPRLGMTPHPSPPGGRIDIGAGKDSS